MSQLYRCILVCDDSSFAHNAFDALAKSDVQVASIWCTNISKFALRITNIRFFGVGNKKRKFANILAENNSPIKQIDRPYLQNLNEALTGHGHVDFILSAGTGLIFPRQFLNNLSIPIINLHPALLPAYRGPKPTHAMVLNGDADKFGGMTAHILSAEIDAGPIIKQNTVRLSDFPSIFEWKKSVYAQSHDLVQNGILPYLRGELLPVQQDESKSSYFSMAQVASSITQNMSFAEAENFARKAPWIYVNTKLHFTSGDGTRKSIRVNGAPINLGPITGQSAKLKLLTIELDLQDARVQFQVNHWMRRQKIKIARTLKSVSKQIYK
jgi:methionyl-tRNA formyltransferase